MRPSTLLSFPPEADSRRHKRRQVTLQGRVRELGWVAMPAKVTDLSLAGCRLEEVDLPQRAEIWLTLGKLAPARARVVWAAGGAAGCEFYEPIKQAQFHGLSRPLN